MIVGMGDQATTKGGGRGCVAAGHEETARAAAIILEEGGNAFDAALAGLFAATVAEPVLTSLGGGGFCLAAPEGRNPVVYDFFAHTPKQRRPDADIFPIVADFGTAQQEFHIGMGTIAVPGVVRGAFALHRDLGRMPLQRIMEPAIGLARDGVRLNALQAYIFRVVQAIYLSNETCRAHFESRTNPGAPLGEGDRFAMPEAADVMETLAREGEDFFYQGEVAARLAADCEHGGGSLSLGDLKDYQVVKRAPLMFDASKARVAINPPPSTGGLLVAFGFALLKGATFDGGFGSLAHLHALLSTLSATNLARAEGGLHDLSEADMAGHYLHPDFIARYRDDVAGHPPAHRGTTHISVIDKDANAAALTVSNGEGAAYMVPGTGIMMNNMLGEEDINPGGIGGWPVDRRMSSMMAPAFAVSADGVMTVLGSGGSNRIRSAILQTLINLFDFTMPLTEAVCCPRIHLEGGKLSIEAGFKPEVIEGIAFANKEVWDEKNIFFGGVHAVRLDTRKATFEGAGDPRRGGVSMIA